MRFLVASTLVVAAVAAPPPPPPPPYYGGSSTGVYTPSQTSASWPGRTSTTTGTSIATGPHPYPPPSRSTVNAACSSVSRLASSFTSASPSATPTVPAELAYECINSVPFNQSAAVALLDSLRPYLQWQTTIEYLKQPPAEYAAKVQPAYDFWANFDRIYKAAVSGSYKNEYSFGFDLYRAFQAAHDGHFVLYPDSVAEIFAFGRTVPLVSVSLDGSSLPQIYLYADILQTFNNTSGHTASAVTHINDRNSTEWLLGFAENGNLQDPDALWNNVFYELAQVSLGPSGSGVGAFAGGGQGRRIYPGPDTKLTFANGTTYTTVNFARVLVPFDNITSGEDIYQTFFVPPPAAVVPAAVAATQTPPTSTPLTTPSTSPSTTIPAPGYPSPIVREMNNLNSGYFLGGDDYDDVAVLSVQSFVAASGDEVAFQDVNSELIQKAVSAGKTKLIVDLSANGGGTILQGYDLFKQLFPHILPYGANRFRAHEALNYVGQEASLYSGLVPRSLSDNATTQQIVATPFNYRTDTDINYKPFTSWAQKYGPHAYGPQPDNFTTIQRWNLSDALAAAVNGIDVSGYLNRSNVTTQPFKAENIVLVYDGYCASTCAIFSELMTAQGGVKTIALGGRPNKNIIQAVGGVKGVNDLTYPNLFRFAETVFSLHFLHSVKFYNATILGKYTTLPLWRTLAAVVNARDGIRQGDTSELPLQFVYQPADCRIFYTPEMVVDETAIWKTVADTAFRGINHCVARNAPPPYPYSSSKQPTVSKLGSRVDMNLSYHFESIHDVWTGKGGAKTGGDGVMIV